MTKKITRWSLMNILFAILVSIPLWSIVVRTGYVLLNKNAYQSYYGETINEENIININYNNYQLNKTYKFNNLFYLDNLGTPNLSNNNNYFYAQIEESDNQYIEVNNSYYFVIFRYDTWSNDEVQYYIYSNRAGTRLTNLYKENTYNIKFKLLDFSLQSDDLKPYYYMSYIEYNSYSFLDNVFDYSIDKFNSENDAHFDFVSTIANMFITEDSYGWRYVEFVNWYFNYFIVISAVYILFLAIIWFIAVSRRLIERSMNLW